MTEKNNYLKGAIILSVLLGKFDFVSLTPEKLENALDVIRNSFFLHENVCTAVELPKHTEAAKELEELCVRAGRDGTSVIAIEKSTGKVVGVAFNKVQVRGDEGDSTYFEKYAASCKHESSKCLVQFMIDSDAECNLFDHYNVDCLIEIMFLATLPEYWGKGIARKLCEVSESLSVELLKGKNVKCSLNEKPVTLEPVPKVISAIFTSFITKKIGEQLGYATLADVSYDKFSFQGRTFLERVGEHTKSITLASKRLK